MPIDQKFLEEIATDDEDTEFSCPKCGSSHFGSSQGTYFCHDEFNCGCRWSGDSEGHFYPTRGAIARELLEARATITQLEDYYEQSIS